MSKDPEERNAGAGGLGPVYGDPRHMPGLDPITEDTTSFVERDLTTSDDESDEQSAPARDEMPWWPTKEIRRPPDPPEPSPFMTAMSWSEVMDDLHNEELRLISMKLSFERSGGMTEKMHEYFRNKQKAITRRIKEHLEIRP